MFDENVKYADELIYCKSIVEDETGKTYTFEDGRTIHLDKDTKIISKPIDGKVKIEKNGKIGLIVFYTDTHLKEFENQIKIREEVEQREIKDAEKDKEETIESIENKIEKIEKSIATTDSLKIEYAEDSSRVKGMKQKIENLTKFFEEAKNNYLTLYPNEEIKIEERKMPEKDYYGDYKISFEEDDYDYKKIIDNKTSTIERLKQNKAKSIETLESDIKKYEKNVTGWSIEVNDWTKTKEEIEKLIANINNEEYINDFLQRLKKMTYIEQEMKLAIIYALNDIRIYYRESYERSIEDYTEEELASDKKMLDELPHEGIDKVKQVYILSNWIEYCDKKIENANYGKNNHIRYIEERKLEPSEIDKKIENEKKDLKSRLEDNISDLAHAIKIANLQLEIDYKYACRNEVKSKAKLIREYIEPLRIATNGSYSGYEGKKTISFEVKEKEIEISFDHKWDRSTSKDIDKSDISIDGKKVYSNGEYVDDSLETINELIECIKEYIDDKKEELKKEITKCKEKYDEKLIRYASEKERGIAFIEDKKKVGYYTIEPIYNSIYAENNYIDGETDSEIHFYNDYIDLISQIEKHDDYKRINDTIFYNNNKIHDGRKEYEASIEFSKDNSITYILTKRKETVHVDIFHRKYDVKELITYDKSGKEIGRIDANSIYHITPTNENCIIKCDNEIINTITGEKVEYDYCTDFTKGCALLTNDKHTYILDKHMKIKELDFELCDTDKIETFEEACEEGYFSIRKYDEKKGYIFGYCDITGNIVIPINYNDFPKSREALDKYLASNEKKEKKENSIFKKIIDKLNKNKEKEKKVVEEQPVQQQTKKTLNQELYDLEEKIENYLDIIKISELDVKLLLMKSNYKKEIEAKAKADVEKRTNIMLNNSSIELENGDTSMMAFENYKNQLIDFIHQIEDKKYIVDILDKINNMLEMEPVERTDEDKKQKEEMDPVITQVEMLLELYTKLNEDARKRNVEELRKELQEEKDYFKNYFFRKNYSEECKYESEEAWDKAFSSKLQVLIYKFQEEYDLQVLSQKLKDKNNAMEALDNNRFSIAIIDIEHINETIKEIETMTNDSRYLNQLDKYRNIEIDYSKTPIENIDAIRQKLMDILKLKENVRYSNAPKELASYDPDNKKAK